jgi:hypothetical protein
VQRPSKTPLACQFGTPDLLHGAKRPGRWIEVGCLARTPRTPRGARPYRIGRLLSDTNLSHLGTILDLSEDIAKPLLYRERGLKAGKLEIAPKTSAVQRKRCKNGLNSAAYGQRSPFKSAGKISIPMGVSERQKGAIRAV